MRVIIQRVKYAKVEVNDNLISEIGNGLLVFVGFETIETISEMEWMINKILNLRIFADDNGKMNLSLKEIGGQILIVSQFTLFASTKKGNRPSFIKSASNNLAIDYYNKFIKIFETIFQQKIEKGIFGENMQISIINDGPVTIFIDSKNKE